MYQQITVKTLKLQGKKVSEIARLLNCHRNTVRNILERDITEKQTCERKSSFNVYHPRIEELLNQGLTRLRVWEILQEDHQVGRCYSAFVKYCKEHIKITPESFIVQETIPGQEAEVDFGYLGLFSPLYGSSQKVKVWVFVMTLSYSREAFYKAVCDQSLPTFLKLHQEAFDYFGGVPKEVKVDNLKAAIIKNGRWDLEVNKTYLEFSLHYQFIIKPCTPRSPNQKGKVESGVGYIKKNFLAGRTFTDVSDLNTKLKDWMIFTANKRIHGTTKKVPHKVFLQTEKRFLQTLPASSFPLTLPVLRTVSSNCHITFQNNYYSVPANYVGETVEVRVDGNILSVYSGPEIIAKHPISSGSGIFITNPAHYDSSKVYSKTTYQAKYEARMADIGENSHIFFLKLIEKTNLWLPTIKKILYLATIYPKEKIDKAIKRALYFEVTKASVIEKILKDNLEETELEPIPQIYHTEQKEADKQNGNHEFGNGKLTNGEILTRSLTYYAN